MARQHDLTRRGAIAIGGATATGLLLAACAPGGSAGSDGAGGSGSGGSGSGSGGPEVVAKLSEIPVGGSIDATLAGAPILLAQPTAGTVLGYSAICTHQRCTVAAAGAEFDCPCHGSRFDASTGDPKPGSPALTPLAKLTITVDGDEVTARA